MLESIASKPIKTMTTIQLYHSGSRLKIVNCRPARMAERFGLH